MMSPEQRLRLVELELDRWLADGRVAPVREAVHADRLGWIVRGGQVSPPACLVDPG